MTDALPSWFADEANECLFAFSLWLARHPDKGEAARRACFEPWWQHGGAQWVRP